jgi:hypothetical protein
LWEKRLADGQAVLVPEPPGADAAAVIEIASIHDTPPTQADHPGFRTLAGVVSRLTLDPRSGDILATVIVTNLPFTARLHSEQVIKRRLLPGTRVHAVYRPDAVRWV